MTEDASSPEGRVARDSSAPVSSAPAAPEHVSTGHDSSAPVSSAPDAPARPARRWPQWLWSVLAVGATAGVALRWVDLTWGGIIPVLQTLVSFAGLSALALLIWAWMRKWKNRVLLILPAVLAWSLATLPDFVVGSGSEPSFPRGQAQRTHATQTITVVSANLHVGEADPQAVVAAVKELRADVVVLVEASSAAVQRLRAAGLPTSLRNATPSANPNGTAASVVLTSLPLSKTGMLREGPHGFEQPYGTLDVCGTPVAMLGAHTSPPVPGLAHLWRPTLKAVGEWAKQVPAQGRIRPSIMAGDFNASLDHPALRKETRGFLNAHTTRGQGWVPTWPIGRKTPPFVQLDHIFTRHLGVEDAGATTLPGSDHRAVWARLSVGCTAANK